MNWFFDAGLSLTLRGQRLGINNCIIHGLGVNGWRPLMITNISRELQAGDTLIEATPRIGHPRLWNLDAPFLYHVTARVAGGPTSPGGAAIAS
jgi:beta-galactosidase/beta-glucuronidase